MNFEDKNDNQEVFDYFTLYECYMIGILCLCILHFVSFRTSCSSKTRIIKEIFPASLALFKNQGHRACICIFGSTIRVVPCSFVI